jgi:hypothetical protein
MLETPRKREYAADPGPGGLVFGFCQRTSQIVDLMGSDPLVTVVEAKNGDFFPSTAVMKGSDPIKSTLV